MSSERTLGLFKKDWRQGRGQEGMKLKRSKEEKEGI
jgi:hypothetical protein